jgi:hypothetical protein
VSDRIVDAYVEAASEFLPIAMNSTRCLNGSRVALEVHAYPLSVLAMAFNAAYITKAREVGRFSESVEELEGWFQECGAHSVGVGYGKQQNDAMWPGHLVVIARGYLVESSAISMHRPQHNMLLGEVAAFDTSPDFLAGKEALVVEGPGGVLIRYENRKGDESYKPLAGFQRSAHNLAAAKRIITLMKGRL